MRTISNLSASFPVRRISSKGLVQVGSSFAPKSLHDIATNVHCAVASFERLFLTKNSGISTMSSLKELRPFSDGNSSASAAGMTSLLHKIGLLFVKLSSFTAQKYPRACSSNTFLSTPVLGFFFNTKSPGKMCLPWPSGCIMIFLFLRALRSLYSASQDELVERRRENMLHGGIFVVHAFSSVIGLCAGTIGERTRIDIIFSVIDVR
mmetsp:Transcript_967/g.1878  ORF Transcript_967/g.1878 Transcript_967/m.1878 type:complete len:207 (-) Transcript_967:223-843(-)